MHVAHALQEVLHNILDIHKSDELMFTETVPPYTPLDEVCSATQVLRTVCRAQRVAVAISP